MMIFDITRAGAFANAIDTAAKSDARKRVRGQPVKKPKKPIVGIFIARLLAVFIF